MERISWSRQGGSRQFYVNRFDVNGEFRYPPHDHEDHWEFVYVLSGFFIHEINGARRRHEAGRLVLIRDSDVHSLRGEEFSYVNLAFPPAWVDRFASFSGRSALRRDLGSLRPVPEASVPEADRSMLAARFGTLLRDPAGVAAFAALLPILLSYVDAGPGGGAEVGPRSAAAGGADPPAASGGGAEAPRWLVELLAWAESRNRPPSVGDLVRKSGYSAEHLIRSLRRHYGATPTRFLADLRLRRAEDLLRFTNYPVSRVADESGWESIRHFERRFRERTGRTPRDFRAEYAIMAH